MKVYELIRSNCNEELKITIADNESDENIACFAISSYLPTQEGDSHIYDGREVEWWEIKRGGLFIYVE